MKLIINYKKMLPVFIVIALVAFFSLAFLLYIPLVKQIQKNKKEYQDYRQETTALKNVLLMAKDHKSKAHLSDADIIDEILEEIIHVGRTHNVTVDFKNPPVEDSNNTSNLYQRMTADFETRATYQSIGAFLSDLRTIEHVVIDISQLLISSDPEDNTRIKVYIKLVFYFSKNNET